MTNLLRSLAVVVPLLLSACTTQVIGGSSGLNQGGGGSGGGAGNGGGDPGTGGVGGIASVAVAMNRAKSDMLWEEYWATHGGSGSSSSSSGGNLDPNDLFLRVSDLGATCTSPTTELDCGGHWNLTLVVPSALQQPGSYDLESDALVQYSVMSETGPASADGSGECSWGGGSLGAGTLEILALDPAAVHFRLTMTSGIWESDPSGEYTAPRCQ